MRALPFPQLGSSPRTDPCLLFLAQEDRFGLRSQWAGTLAGSYLSCWQRISSTYSFCPPRAKAEEGEREKVITSNLLLRYSLTQDCFYLTVELMGARDTVFTFLLERWFSPAPVLELEQAWLTSGRAQGLWLGYFKAGDPSFTTRHLEWGNIYFRAVLSDPEEYSQLLIQYTESLWRFVQRNEE